MTDDVASLSVHQFGERFALSALADHSINISMDLPNGIFDSRSVAVIKQITGGDSLSIEAKNRQPHSDHIRCKLLFGTNHSIELKVRDEAFSQRILLVPFCFPFPAAQQDFDLLDKLKQENGGVIYCALAAYRVFQIVQLFPGPCGHIWPDKYSQEETSGRRAAQWLRRHPPQIKEAEIIRKQGVFMENCKNSEPILYTVKRVGQLLHTNGSFVYELIRRGLLPAIKLCSLRVRRETLENFLQKHEGRDLSNLDDIKPIISAP